MRVPVSIVLATVLGAAAVTVVEVGEAEACSGCFPAVAAPGDGATVPANLPHLTWRPSSSGAGIGDPALLTLTRDDAPGVPVPFTATRNDDFSYRLVPDQPLVAGHSYTLTDSKSCQQFSGTITETWTFQVTDAAPLPTALGTLSAAAAERVTMQLATGASCQSTHDLVRVPVDIARDPSAEPWKDALFYSTFVDGQAWRPYEHLLEPPPPGGNWRGRGDDWLYSICASATEQRPNSNLEEGTHQVEIRATLPGTNLSLVTSAISVTLQCAPTPPPPDAGVNPDASGAYDESGGGCSGSRGGSPLGVALVLAISLIAVGLRRRRLT